MSEEKKYKIDKSKEALSDKPWGEVDKTKLRNDIMGASNKNTLVKDVYMLVEDGWEDAPSEHLKYPVMELKGDTFVYNRDGLSSALGYAKKENVSSVVSKVEKIQRKLGLFKEGKEADTEMSTKYFDEIEGRKAWADVIEEVQEHEGRDAYVDSIEKDHIIYTKDDVRYRVEADIKVDKDDKTVDADIHWDTVKKDKDQKMSEKKEMSIDEAMAEIDRLSKDVEDNKNIIMDKDKQMKDMEKELSELRAFKEAADKQTLAASVESVMSEVKDCLSDDKYKEFRDEGLQCSVDGVDAWANKVKAFCFETGVKKKAQKGTMWSFANPVQVESKINSIW